MKGDKGRQVNLSAWRAVPGIQAGRQRETNEGRQRETSEPVRQASRLGDNGRQMKGDKGRQVRETKGICPPGEPCQARHPGWETTRDK